MDELCRREEVRYLGGLEIREAFMRLEGADEDVAWEEGLEVYQGEGVCRLVEDLVGDLKWPEMNLVLRAHVSSDIEGLSSKYLLYQRPCLEHSLLSNM